MESARAGETVTRSVTVSNDAAAAAHIELEAGGAIVDARGFSLDEDERAAIARWTTVTPGALDLDAGASATARVRIEVPRDTTDGERYGVVWARVGDRDDDGRAVVNRVGVRVFLLVGDDDPDADVVIETMTPSRTDTGAPVIELALHNRGVRAVDVHGSVQLDDDAHDLDPDADLSGMPTIAPGGRGIATATFDDGVANGPWTATATLDANGVERVARATIAFPATDGERGDAVPASMVGEDGVPVGAAAVATAAIALVAVVVWQVRRRRSV